MKGLEIVCAVTPTRADDIDLSILGGTGNMSDDGGIFLPQLVPNLFCANYATYLLIRPCVSITTTRPISSGDGSVHHVIWV
jgi:hypothetical protein